MESAHRLALACWSSGFHLYIEDVHLDCLTELLRAAQYRKRKVVISDDSSQ